MRAFYTSVFSAAAVLVGSATAHAALLAPGGTLLPAPAEAAPGGGVIASSLVPFVSPGNFSGSVLTEVLAGDPSNPFPGGLTFVYTVLNDGVAGPNAIGRVTIESYAGFLTDTSYNAPGVGVAPALINRSAVIGDVMGFNFFSSAVDPFTGVLAPGLTSRTLVVQTNAPAFTTGTMFIIDGGITSALVFAPAVPAPGALALLAVAPLVGRRRRRS